MASNGPVRHKTVPGNALVVFQRSFAYWRVVFVALVFSLASLIVLQGQFVSFSLFLLALLLIFIASQIFWIGRAIDLTQRLLPPSIRRKRAAAAVVFAYLFVVSYSFPTTIAQGHTFRMGFYRLPNTLTEAVFWWWFVGSMLAFLPIMAFALFDRTIRALAWIWHALKLPVRRRLVGPAGAIPFLSSRRQLLRQTAVLISATPFAASAYGLIYGRRDLEVVRHRVYLSRLPDAFGGFRIAQLSDIHLGPFTSADYIRRCVAVTNALQPHLIALTGDYIAWDPSALGDVVRELAALRAPHGVFACLGNHEEESDTEEYITGLFRRHGIRVLRQQSVPIRLAGDMINLIGIDDPRGTTDAEWLRNLGQRLHSALVMPRTVNVLLAHEPSIPVVDRAAELGIDLMLSGHTHGGQLALDSIRRGTNLSRLIYRYTSGWYENRATKLYVNRGIGTTGFPIRLGARPEVTLFELAK